VDLHVSLDGSTDLSGQIYRQIRSAILDNRLRPGEPLPSTRDAAARLSVSRNTVATAYDHLIAEGFLTSRSGVGTFVSERVRGQDPEPAGAAVPLPTRAIWDTIRTPPVLSDHDYEFDFRAGMPDAREFPYATWRALVSDQLRDSAVGPGAYGDPAGHLGLRVAIARHIAVSRSVHTTPEQVIITSGTQQALDVVARVVIEPGDVVAVEDPGYLSACLVFASLGARVVGIPVDDEGLQVDRLPDNAKLVFVSPSHQLPLGVRMSLPRRQALLAWADRVGSVVIEDDYDSEFRFTGRPIEPLHTLDSSGRVVYIGTFSKTMLPTLRLGFCVAPVGLVSPMRKAKYALDWHTAIPMQAALAEFIDRGLFARHLRRMRTIYQTRRELIAMALERDFSPYLQLISSVAGLHLTATMRSGGPGEARAWARRARGVGVGIRALSDFAITPSVTDGLVFGYGMIATDRIDEGLKRLRASLD